MKRKRFRIRIINACGESILIRAYMHNKNLFKLNYPAIIELCYQTIVNAVYALSFWGCKYPSCWFDMLIHILELYMFLFHLENIHKNVHRVFDINLFVIVCWIKIYVGWISQYDIILLTLNIMYHRNKCITWHVDCSSKKSVCLWICAWCVNGDGFA